MHSPLPLSPFAPSVPVYLSGKIHLHAKQGAEGGHVGFRRLEPVHSHESEKVGTVLGAQDVAMTAN